MKLDSTNFFLAVMALAMFSVVCVLVLILWMSSDAGPPPGECDPEGLSDDCPVGFYCNENSICDPLVVAPPEVARRICRPGMAMTACDECPIELEVRDGVCERPRSANACQHAEVAAFIDELARKCELAVPGQLEVCPQRVIRQLVIDKQREILKIAALFSDRSFTVHFDISKPTPAHKGTWPSTAERERLRDAVHERLTADVTQGYLLMVALASHTGPDELNYKLATRRSDTIVAIAGEARAAFPALDARLKDIRYLVGIVGDKHAALDIATFDERWGRSGRFLAWDEASTRRIADDLAVSRDRPLDAREEKWLARTLNQAVLVIPLPCRPALVGATTPEDLG